MLLSWLQSVANRLEAPIYRCIILFGQNNLLVIRHSVIQDALAD